jgi:tetratricopeptide (TPR) repeat protein
MLKRLAGAWFRCFVFTALAATTLHAAVDDQFESLVKSAFQLHRQGDFSAALPLLRRAYAIQPDNYFVNLLLGIDSLRTGDASAAIPHLKKASHLRPKEEYPLSYLGEAYGRQAMYADAAASYLKGVDAAPSSAESSVAFVDFALSRFADLSTVLRSSSRGLAQEYRLRARALDRKDSGRISLLKRAADLDPKSPGVWSELAEAAVQSGDWAAAAEQCSKGLDANPNDLAAWMADGELAAHAGDWKKTDERLNAIAQRSPKILSREVTAWPKQFVPPPGASSSSAATFFRCVRESQATCNILPSKNSSSNPGQLFREQRWEELTKAPVASVNSAKQWLEQGIAFSQLDDCERAIPALERGVKEATPDFYGMFQLSWCYSQEAGRIAERVQQSSENEASVHMMRGDILLRLQAKPELALEEYQQAIAADAHDPSVLERLAEAQFGAGKIDAARSTAETALKIDPHRQSATRTLAQIAVQDRDYTTALPFLKELAERNPNDLTGRVELGKAYAQLGSLNEARENLAPALEHGYPDEKGTLHYLLGTVLRKMGKTSDAESAFAQATRLSDAFQQKSYSGQDADAKP